MRHNFEFQGPYEIWLRDLQSRQFAFQIAFSFNFCTPFRTNVMPVQNSDIFMKKTGDPLIFAPRVFGIYPRDRE